MGINWVGTKGIVLSSGLIDERTQINLEFLKDPHFRIYALLRDDDTRQQLGHLLQNHMSVYTPCLGVSELLADFKWIGWQEAQFLGEGTYEISSALPAEKVIWPSAGQGVYFEQGRRYTRIRVPRILEKSRSVAEWQDLLVETSANSIKAHVSEGWQVGDDIVVWL